jgi:hypothetical protein
MGRASAQSDFLEFFRRLDLASTKMALACR